MGKINISNSNKIPLKKVKEEGSNHGGVTNGGISKKLVIFLYPLTTFISFSGVSLFGFYLLDCLDIEALYSF